jgi:alpha-galactosidase
MLNCQSQSHEISYLTRGAIVLSCLALISFIAPALALNDGQCRTPPMGWSSWNWFRCSNTQHGQLNSTMVLQMADAMISSGMKDAGYQYVNIDDCWGAHSRDSRGGLQGIPGQFSDMRALVNQVHAKGLKLGLYTCLFEYTCAEYYDGGGQPGLWGHYQQDADTFVAWGIDYLKVDYCNNEAHPGISAAKQYSVARDAFKKAVTDAKARGNTNAHPFIFSICNWGVQQPWLWGDTVGHLWRTGGDISIDYNSFLSQVDGILNLYSYAGPGHWNDPDMMQVGNGLATNEDRVHVSMWCIMAAPLVAGNDIRSMTTTTKTMLINKEIIAIDQDSLGAQGRKVKGDNSSQVLVKKLKDGGYGVLFVNRSNAATTISATWQEIGSADPQGGGLTAATPLWGRDLWAHQDLGRLTTSYSKNVPARDVFFMRLYNYDYTNPTATRPSPGMDPVSALTIKQENKTILIRGGADPHLRIIFADALGKVFKAFDAATNELTIPVSELGKGLMLVTVQSGGRTLSRPFMIR